MEQTVKITNLSKLDICFCSCAIWGVLKHIWNYSTVKTGVAETQWGDQDSPRDVVPMEVVEKGSLSVVTWNLSFMWLTLRFEVVWRSSLWRYEALYFATQATSIRLLAHLLKLRGIWTQIIVKMEKITSSETLVVNCRTIIPHPRKQ
jgi:hypothetical protein